jgi:membrane AbrB-like protein
LGADPSVDVRRVVFHYVSTLVMGVTMALIFKALRWPLPWMLGPLLAVSAASMLGFKTRSYVPFRNFGQWIIGLALGLYFSPDNAHVIAQMWWVIVLSVAWALIIGAAFGVFLYALNRHSIQGLTLGICVFSSAIGGASEMTLLAEREKVRTDLVASAHSMRVMVIALVIPFTLKALGIQGSNALLANVHEFDALGFAELCAMSAVSVYLLQKWGRANPWFLGALLLSMALSTEGIYLSGVPAWMVNAGQMFLGVSLGVRFTKEFIKMAPRWLLSVVLGSILLVIACSGFAYAMAELDDQNLLTLILGTAPGGIAEMALTAKALQLAAPLVTSLQVCRLIAVLFLLEPIYRLGIKRFETQSQA